MYRKDPFPLEKWRELHVVIASGQTTRTLRSYDLNISVYTMLFFKATHGPRGRWRKIYQL